MNAPQRFRKRPVEIEAMQWTGDNPAAMRAFTGMHATESGGEHFVFTTQSGHGELFVAANGAWLPLEIGEWVLSDARGFYPCKPDIFAQTYDELEATAHPISSGRILVEGSGLTVGKPPMTATVQVRVVAEGAPVAGVILGTVNLIAPPQHVDEVRATIARALS